MRVGFGDLLDLLQDTIDLLSRRLNRLPRLLLRDFAGGHAGELVALESAAAGGSIAVNRAAAALMSGAGLTERGSALFRFEIQAEGAEGAGGVLWLENNGVEKSAVTTHPTGGAEGLGELR